MAGGMNKRGSWGPMAERVGSSASEDPAVSAAAPPIRHCWIDGRDGRVPALLLEWSRSTGVWMARVVRPVLEGGHWMVVEEWVAGELLEPA